MLSVYYIAPETGRWVEDCEGLLRQAGRLQLHGKEWLAEQQCRLAMQLARRMMNTSPIPAACMLLQAARAMAELLADANLPQQASMYLASTHDALLSVLQQHQADANLRGALQRCCRASHQLLTAHAETHGMHASIETALRSGCMKMCVQNARAH